jgi:DNA-binding MarR family transcriptional regulator
MSVPALQATDPVRETSHVPPPYDLIELLFFAYRDFVGEADLVLGAYGFGRAHHRVLHFVDRLPGLTIAELLDILRITKQSLNRVLRDLVEAGFIEQRAGVSDRRRRLLVTTRRGETLARELARVQSARIAKGLSEAGLNEAGLAESGDETRATVLRFLAGMVGENDRDHVLELVARGRINGPHL